MNVLLFMDMANGAGILLTLPNAVVIKSDALQGTIRQDIGIPHDWFSISDINMVYS